MEPILITTLPDAGNREQGLETVPIPLTAADRRRVRRLLTAPDGQAFYLALPTGTVLRPGTVLWAGGGRAYMVTAAEEDLLRVRPRTLREAAQVGHLLGNLHRDMVAEGRFIYALWDEGLYHRLRQKGFAVERVQGPFVGNAPGEHAH